MAELDSDEIFARLRRLPWQLLLALVNATAILVIVAAVLALVALARIDHFVGNLAETTTEGVLSKVDLPPKEALADLRSLAAEVRALRKTLLEAKAEENALLQSEIARLRGALTALSTSVERLGNAQSNLVDEAIGQLARAAGDTLTRLRDCARPTAGSIIANPHDQPHRAAIAAAGSRAVP